MSSLKHIFLDTQVHEYIQSWLKNGSTLCQFILENVDLRKGKIYTYVPDYASNEEIYNFEAGIYRLKEEQEIVYKLPNGKLGAIHKRKTIANAEYWLVEEIHEDFEKRISNVGLFEDIFTGPDALSYHKKNYLDVGADELYSYIRVGDSKEKLFTVINGIPNFRPPLLGALFFDSEFKDGYSPVLSNKYFEDVSKKIHKLIVGAYDSEGYIIWENKI